MRCLIDLILQKYHRDVPTKSGKLHSQNRVPTVMEILESHEKVMENLLEIKSHKILLRAEKNFFKLLVIPAVAVT